VIGPQEEEAPQRGPRLPCDEVKMPNLPV